MLGKLSENLILFVLASFAFMSLFGMSVGMEERNGQMSSCPFMANGASLCQMNVTEHIVQWQQALLGIPTKGSFLALGLLLPFLVIIPFAKPFSQIKAIEQTTHISFYHRDTFAKVFDPFLIAFSDGILNPKIYEPARI